MGYAVWHKAGVQERLMSQHNHAMCVWGGVHHVRSVIDVAIRFFLLLNVYAYNSLCDNGGVVPHVMAHVCMPPSRCPDVALRWPPASEGRHQGVLAPP